MKLTEHDKRQIKSLLYFKEKLKKHLTEQKKHGIIK